MAIVGGALAIATAWLPWETYAGAAINPIDLTDRTSDLANGYYLIGAGLLAVLCGLVLLLGSLRARNMAMLLGLGAVIGGALAIAVEAVAYNDVSDAVKLVGGGAAVGYGLYLGIAGGAIAVIGGVLALRKRA